MDRFQAGVACVLAGVLLLVIVNNWSNSPFMWGLAYIGSLLCSVIGVGMLVSLLRISWR
ncbi:hypothetical protein FLK61_27710 [Paenalkalicoccus suaedae]|uniref:Uncharacterized protein n=1 Tax=Paenalkalicoccus suaedae TaxID=2592382 RepID=A0A859FC68_9BACI|nr:hypothetical protein [Paenalkalicoccus suaedae]QKS70540.1 hypothetical protein FLK61_27710 [Paenalkalicoccus suaedae]